MAGAAAQQAPSDEDVERAWNRDLATWQEPWRKALQSISQKDIISYFNTNRDCVNPKPESIFKAFGLTPIGQVKIVIVGNAPTPTSGLATGIAFSAPRGNRISIKDGRESGVSPSTIKILKELYRTDPDFEYPNHGCLEDWARQGVLLINNSLFDHTKNFKDRIGKQYKKVLTEFRKEVIRVLCQKAKEGTKIVFMLWGSQAKENDKIVKNWANAEENNFSDSVLTLDASEQNDKAKNEALFIFTGLILILTSTHPTYEPGGTFYGSDHFLFARRFIKPETINWQLPDEVDNLTANMADLNIENNE